MRRVFAVACLLAAGCGGAPSGPSSPPAAPSVVSTADYGGLWAGSFRLTGCDGDRHCVLLKGTNRPFTLRLTQTGARVSGIFTASSFAADVTGEVLKDGTLALSGADAAATARDGSMTAHLTLLIDPAGALTGSVAYLTQPPPSVADFTTAIDNRGDILATTRGDLSSFASGPEGTWSGRFAVRACVAVSLASGCYPYGDQTTSNARLVLTRAGAGVSGTLTLESTSMTVSGTVNGSNLVLGGETLLPASGGPTRIRVAGWNGAIDRYGRMTATFRFEYAFPASDSRIGESATVEFWQVVKQP